MRRLIFCIALLMMLIFCGCGEDNDLSSDTDQLPSSSVTIESEDLADKNVSVSLENAYDNASSLEKISNSDDEEEMPTINPFE